ncbi:JAB domain-containing protein, partial [Klebsiella pneumoniae]|uniref:JAB domain-containing protein n=1 Tax=Klebsiella pneumoniae TaxID=573 RepID=UPI003967E852
MGVNTAAVILANNHPSGISEPSHAGKVMRVQIKKGLGIVDMRTLAHFTSWVTRLCTVLYVSQLA